MSDTLLLDLSPEDRKGLGKVLAKAAVTWFGSSYNADAPGLADVLADAAVDYLDVADPDDEGGES